MLDCDGTHLQLTGTSSPSRSVNIPINWSPFVTGSVILAAVSLDAPTRNRRERGHVDAGRTAVVDPWEPTGDG